MAHRSQPYSAWESNPWTVIPWVGYPSWPVVPGPPRPVRGQHSVLPGGTKDGCCRTTSVAPRHDDGPVRMMGCLWLTSCHPSGGDLVHPLNGGGRREEGGSPNLSGCPRVCPLGMSHPGPSEAGGQLSGWGTLLPPAYAQRRGFYPHARTHLGVHCNSLREIYEISPQDRAGQRLGCRP